MSKAENTCPRCGLVFVPGKLESLCPACLFGDTLDLVDDGQDTTAFWEDKAASAAEPGRRFSHFEILDELGRGGMGTVYKARDHVTNRIVALKVLQAHHLFEVELMQRFRSEVRAISSLDHRHILPIHEVGEHDGVPFFSMKLASGGSLAQHLSDYVGHPRRAAELLVKVVRGVQHAHERGILHRDLKPGNILLDETAEPFVCDFGLAKWLEDDRRLTLTSVVLGTPHYIAPEQASGKQDLTTAADIYSLGAILYELLTGRPPFVGETAFDTLRQASQNSPAKPSSIVHGTPRDLETICLKALEREPAARYATAGALADDLDHWLAGRPIRARPVGAAEQLWRWGRRNPLPAALSATLVLALTVIAIGSTIAAINIDRSRTQAVAAQDRATAAEHDAREKLYESLLTQARASRKTGQVGHRIETLKAIKEAVAIRPSLDLRNEAIAALQLVDLELKNIITFSDGRSPNFDSTLSTIAVITKNNDIDIIDCDTNRVIHSILCGGEEMRKIVHSGSRYLAARCSNGEIFIWELLRNKLIRSYFNHPTQPSYSGVISDNAFSPDEKYFVMGSPAGFEIVNVETGDEVARQLTFQPNCIALDPTLRYVAWGANNKKSVQVWDYKSRALPLEIPLPAQATCVAWSADGKQLAVGCVDTSIKIISVNEWKISHTLTGHSHTIMKVVFNPSGDKLVSAARDGMYRLWDLQTQSALFAMEHDAGAEAVFSPDGRRLALADRRDSASIFSIDGLDRPAKNFPSVTNGDISSQTASVDYSPDSTLLATASSNGFQVFDSKRSAIILEIKNDSPTTTTVRFLPDGKTLAVVSTKEGLTYYRYRYENGGLELTSHQPNEVFPSRCILGSSPTGHSSLLCLTSFTNEISIIWDSDTQQIIKRPTETLPCLDIVVSPDEKWIATSYLARTGRPAQIRSFITGKPVVDLPGGVGGVLSFSPSGRWLAWTGIGDYKILWDTRTWTPWSGLPAHIDDRGVNFAFSFDEQVFAVALPGSVSLMALPSGRLFASLPAAFIHTRIRFSPDGRQLALHGGDNSLALWNLPELRRQLRELNLDWED